MSILSDLRAAQSHVENAALLANQISEADPSELESDDLDLYRIYIQDLTSINTEVIALVSRVNRDIRALKAVAFSLRKGEAPESVRARLDKIAEAINNRS